MTDRNALMELAERCEAAGWEDRELDADIAIATRWPPLGRISHWANEWAAGLEKTQREGWLKLAGHEHEDHWKAPEYTASLDAAMTLVPEGCEVTLDISVPKSTAQIFGEEPLSNATGTTPALALCAAALRARAAIDA